jgi:hypothetical protein
LGVLCGATFLPRIRYELQDLPGRPLFRKQFCEKETTFGQGVAQMKGVRGLVVVFKDGRRHEFNLKKETTWQYVFYLLKWIALFYPDHEKIELMQKEQGHGSSLGVLHFRHLQT